jgi:hypothetical protein
MWTDEYFQETMIREQMAEARRVAARQHLLRRATASRPRRRCWPFIQQLVGAAAIPWLKRHIERRALP